MSNVLAVALNLAILIPALVAVLGLNRARNDWKRKYEELSATLGGSRSASPPGRPSAPRGGLPPNNLPALGSFVGRKSDVQAALQSLTQDRPIAALIGLPGMGKSHLALATAHASLDAAMGRGASAGGHADAPVFDMYVWFEIESYRTVLNDLLDRIAGVAGDEPIRRAATDDKLDSIRRLLQGRRTLIIVDGLEALTDDEIPDFLANLPDGARVLAVWSRAGPSIWLRRFVKCGLWIIRATRLRRSLQDLLQVLQDRYPPSLRSRSVPVEVGPLSEQDAERVLRLAVGRPGGIDGAELSADVCAAVVKATGGSPTLILSVAALMEQGEDWRDFLRKPSDVQVKQYRRIYNRFWKHLSRPARRIAYALFAVDAPATVETLGAVAGLSERSADQGLTQLLRLQLVRVAGGDRKALPRYTVIPLLLTYRPQLVVWYYKWRTQRRSLDYFSRFARDRGRDASRWRELDAEWLNIRSTMKRVEEQGRDDLLVQMTDAVAHYLGVRGRWEERVELAQAALGAARRRHSREAECQLLVDTLGWVLLQRDDPCARSRIEEGRQCALQGSPQFANYAALAEGYLAQIELHNGRYDLAEEHLCVGFDLRPEPHFAARLLSCRGDLMLALGRTQDAEKDYAESLRLRREERDAFADCSPPAIELGNLQFARGDVAAARLTLQQAVRTGEEFDLTHRLPAARLGLARVELKEGNQGAGVELLEAALEGFERLGLPERVEETAALLVAASGAPSH